MSSSPVNYGAMNYAQITADLALAGSTTDRYTIGKPEEQEKLLRQADVTINYDYTLKAVPGKAGATGGVGNAVKTVAETLSRYFGLDYKDTVAPGSGSFHTQPFADPGRIAASLKLMAELGEEHPRVQAMQDTVLELSKTSYEEMMRVRQGGLWAALNYTPDLLERNAREFWEEDLGRPADTFDIVDATTEMRARHEELTGLVSDLLAAADIQNVFVDNDGHMTVHVNELQDHPEPPIKADTYRHHVPVPPLEYFLETSFTRADGSEVSLLDIPAVQDFFVDVATGYKTSHFHTIEDQDNFIDIIEHMASDPERFLGMQDKPVERLADDMLRVGGQAIGLTNYPIPVNDAVFAEEWLGDDQSPEHALQRLKEAESLLQKHFGLTVNDITDKKVLMMVGRAEPGKDMLRAIEAVGDVAKDHDDVAVVGIVNDAKRTKQDANGIPVPLPGYRETNQQLPGTIAAAKEAAAPQPLAIRTEGIPKDELVPIQALLVHHAKAVLPVMPGADGLCLTSVELQAAQKTVEALTGKAAMVVPLSTERVGIGRIIRDMDSGLVTDDISREGYLAMLEKALAMTDEELAAYDAKGREYFTEYTPDGYRAQREEMLLQVQIQRNVDNIRAQEAALMVAAVR